MSQTFFSKLAHSEKNSRLSALSHSRGQVTIWMKGQKEKHNLFIVSYDKDYSILVLDSMQMLYPENSQILCTFDFRGMNFFSEVSFHKSVGGFACLKFEGFLYKSEKRASYRLMTYPQFDIWAEFDLGEAYDAGKVIDFKTRKSDTAVFKDFINLVEGDGSNPAHLKIRVQDLSTTGMALHVGELESSYFPKDAIFKRVKINFSDENIVVPQVKIIYAASFVGSDKNIKKYKLGVHFINLPNSIDHWLGKKINTLLRENDNDKDFENLIK